LILSKRPKKKGKVSLVGVWNLQCCEEEGQEREKPANGQGIKIAAKHVPKFTAGKALKDIVK